jgi:enoyl-CoA hydratase/carnithine racemase
MSQTDKMLARKEGGVGIVTFNNPERHNAVSLEMWEATKRILDSFAADDDIRVVVLTGAGGKAFVSGADISKFASERATLEAERAYNAKSDAFQHRRILQADDRDDQRLLHRRRGRARYLLRPAHVLGRFPLRRAGS